MLILSNRLCKNKQECNFLIPCEKLVLIRQLSHHNFTVRSWCDDQMLWVVLFFVSVSIVIKQCIVDTLRNADGVLWHKPLDEMMHLARLQCCDWQLASRCYLAEIILWQQNKNKQEKHWMSPRQTIVWAETQDIIAVVAYSVCLWNNFYMFHVCEEDFMVLCHFLRSYLILIRHAYFFLCYIKYVYVSASFLSVYLFIYPSL